MRYGIRICLLGFLLSGVFMSQKLFSQEDCCNKNAVRENNGYITKWLGVDLLADKYPDVSPYAYCEDNPLMYVDPDGEESVLPEVKGIWTDSVIFDMNRWMTVANYYDKVNPSVIHYIAHGNDNGNIVQTEYNNGKSGGHVEPERFSDYLANHSVLWKSFLNKEVPFMIIVFHSCETGKEGAFAQKFSEQFPGVLVVAASTSVMQDVNTAREWVSSYSGNMEHVKESDLRDKSTRGYWMFYYNGKLVNCMSGATKPTFKLETNEKKYSSGNYEEK